MLLYFADRDSRFFRGGIAYFYLYETRPNSWRSCGDTQRWIAAENNLTYAESMNQLQLLFEFCKLFLKLEINL